MNDAASATAQNRHQSRELPPPDVMAMELANAASPSAAALERLGSDHLAELLGTAGNTVDVQLRDYGERYEPIDILGQGGQGIVLRAKDTLLGREVAIKAVRPPYSKQREEAIEREARMGGLLEHPNILPTYDLSEDETGSPFFVMKKVEGTTLEELLRKAHSATSGGKLRRRDEGGEYSRRRLLAVFLQVCHAVQYAHSRQVFHLDLKPENVKLGPFGEVYVLDWGFAALRTEQPRNMAGTPAYVAPERFRGEPATERCDIYALGVILYRILLNHFPRELDKSGVPLPPQPGAPGGRPPPPPVVAPRTRDPAIPRDLDAIVMKALADDPAGRYASAGELADDLERFLDVLPVAAYAESAWSRAAKLVRRHPQAAAAAGVVLLALAVVFGVSYHYDRQRRVADLSVLQARDDAQRAAEETRRAEEEARRAEGQRVRQLARARAESELRRRQDDVRRLVDQAREGSERLRPYVEREAAASARAARLAHVGAILDQAVEAARAPFADPAFGQLAAAGEEVDPAADPGLRRELAAAHYVRGRVRQMALAPGAALEDFRAAGRIDPANDAAHYQAGRLLLDAGDADGARAEFDAIARHRPDSDYAPLGNALLALHERRPADAARACDQLERAAAAAGRYPPADLWLYRARARLLSGDDAGAVADFGEYLRSQPDDPAVFQQRAVLHYRRFLAARGAEDFVVRDPPDFSLALQDWRTALRLDPGAVEAHRQLADALYYRAWSVRDHGYALREARDAARHAHAIADANHRAAQSDEWRLAAGADPAQLENVRRHVEQARAAAALATAAREEADKRYAVFEQTYANDLAEALREYNAALALAPDHFAALVGRATVHQTVNRDAEALADFRRAVDIARERTRAAEAVVAVAANAADASAGSAGSSGSAPAARALARARDQYGQAAYLAGLFHLYSLDWSGADASLSTALENASDDEQRAERLFRRGQARFMAGDHARARADFVEALPLGRQPRARAGLWRWLSERRLGLVHDKAVYEAYFRPTPPAWEGYMLERYLDGYNPPREADALRLTEGSAPDRCAAMFYLGAYAAVGGDANSSYLARRFLEVSISGGRDWVLEYRFARHWLGALPAAPQ